MWRCIWLGPLFALCYNTKNRTHDPFSPLTPGPYHLYHFYAMHAHGRLVQCVALLASLMVRLEAKVGLKRICMIEYIANSDKVRLGLSIMMIS